MTGKQREKVTLRREKGDILRNKMFQTTKRNNWVGKDLTKSPKKKSFEKNGAV